MRKNKRQQKQTEHRKPNGREEIGKQKPHNLKDEVALTENS